MGGSGGGREKDTQMETEREGGTEGNALHAQRPSVPLTPGARGPPGCGTTGLGINNRRKPGEAKPGRALGWGRVVSRS